MTTNSSYRGHCLHCWQELTAQGGVDVAQHGSEQQGLEAGFEQEAGRKRLDAGHSQRVVITTGSMESYNAMPTLPCYHLCTALAPFIGNGPRL